MQQYRHMANIAQEVVRIGGELIRELRPQSVTAKSDRDTFTDVDVRIERKIRAYLADATPDIGFVGEEEGRSGPSQSSSYYWALDPIDGTSNFVHGIPLCAVQVALINDEEGAVVAAIGLPFNDSLYWAIKDGGAFVNNKPIHVSSTSDLSHAVVSIGDYATGFEADEKNARRIALTASLAQKAERIRMFGSAAHDMAWIAEGRTDAVVILSNSIIDIAAGVLIASEAGAIALDGAGQPHRTASSDTIVATPGIAADVAKIVADL